MTIEEAEDYLQTWSSGNGDTPNAAAAEEAKEVIIDAVREGRHVMKWIRCSERLPETPHAVESEDALAMWYLSDPVLVCGYGADREEGILYGVARCEVSYLSHGKKIFLWCEPVDDVGERIVNAIAWMPIPGYKDGVKVVDWTSIPEHEEEST